MKPDSIKHVLTAKEALILIGLCAGSAGGTPVEYITTRLLSLALGTPLFPHNYEDAKNAALSVMDDMNRVLCQCGIEKSVQTAASVLSGGLKETAFLWATEMVLADREAEQTEKEFLKFLMLKFNINPDIGNKIIEVSMIKNRQ